MKIVQINTVVGRGSVGRITADLYETAKKHGEEALVCFGRGHAPAAMASYKIGTPFDFAHHVLRNFFYGDSGFASQKTTEQFLRFLDEERPDILHLHNLHGFYLQIELLFRYIKEKEIPVVWTLHDCWAMTGHCAYFDYARCNRWKKTCHTCPQQKNAYPYALFKDNSANNFRRKKEIFTNVPNLLLVTPSAWLQGIVKESFLSAYPVRVIYNGIDRAVFTSESESGAVSKKEPQACYQVLGVANVWEKRKGLSYFEELARKLPEKYHITLVGLSARQIRKIHRKEQSAVLPKHKIKGLRNTESRQELASLYREADVYVNTTLEDNFPTTNLEALSCGTPVVTFATGGSPEALDQYAGLVVPKADTAALVQAVRTVAECSKEQRAFYKTACTARAKLFDKNLRFEEYMDLYRQILHKGAGGEL